jgi:hypothetical protein
LTVSTAGVVPEVGNTDSHEGATLPGVPESSWIVKATLAPPTGAITKFWAVNEGPEKLNWLGETETAGPTTNWNNFDALFFRLSITWTFSEKVPTAIGVPLRRPPFDKDRPAGAAP